ncbi:MULTISPECIES: isochorismate synthase [unclassified Streptomyces]|uniref:isochorismate synthase n=1 Tax=unclassified Streptomyces TaxID=2593676 RepID=UPI0034571788
MTVPVREPLTRAPEHPAVTPGGATALLDAYRPGDRFLATPGRTLLGSGTAAEIPHEPAVPLGERVRRALDARRTAGDPAPVVLGCLPFLPDAPPALAVPARLRRGPALRHDPLTALAPPAPAAPGGWKLREVPSADAYARAVDAAVERLRAGEFAKVVLARTLELTGRTAPGLPLMLGRLARRDPGGYAFAVPSAPGRTLLGASPELLVARQDGRLVANPLAGSAPRGTDLAEDVRAAAALLDSAKDLHEHAVVVDAVRAALAPYCARIEVPPRPTLVRTATMWHLSTTVTGDLASPATTALDLAQALHPTPAVCGTPTATARRVIAASEPFDRGAYTGMVGWQDADGDGEWVVTLRCAEAEGDTLRLFAGAGVVAASTGEAEAAETAAKFRTFLDAVGAAL